LEKFFYLLFITAISSGILLWFAACSPTKPFSQPVSGLSNKSTVSKEFDHSHLKFDLLLKKYVCDGWVDYKGIISDKKLFYEYVNAIGNVEAPLYKNWTREQRLAFWINAYNAFTIQAIMERYPIKERSLIGLFFPKNSILQISGIWSRLKFKAVGQYLTLGHIEHDILRKSFNEPRIHFAIVCASRSCPDLRVETYRADILEIQLNDQTLKFINNSQKGVRWDTGKQVLYISKIFKWFKKDFKKKNNTTNLSIESPMLNKPVIRFIDSYINDESLKDIIDGDKHIKVSYLHYDWRLNDQTESPSNNIQKNFGNND
jgi:hypothetical protein